MVVERCGSRRPPLEVTGHRVRAARRGGGRSRRRAEPALDRLLRDAVLCNDAELRRARAREQRLAAVGDPLEAALLALAVKARHPRRRAAADVAARAARSPSTRSAAG